MSYGQPPPHGFGPPPAGPGYGPPGYGPPGHGPPGYGPPHAQPIQPVPINADMALFGGILVAMFCGCLPGGLIAIFLADQAKKAAQRGDAATAQSKLRQSYIASGVSVALLLLIPCLYVAFMVVLGGAGAVLGSV